MRRHEGWPLRCQFAIVERRPDALIIRDTGYHTHMSVTNDAEAAVEHLLASGHLRHGQRLFYYDSEGQLDEITFTEVGFTGFKPGPAR